MNSTLDDLYQHTAEAISANQLSVINDNTEIMIELFSVMLKESNNPYKSKLIDKVDTLLDNLVSTLINRNHLTMAYDTMTQLYTISKENNFKLFMDKTFHALFNRIRFTQTIDFLSTFRMEGLIILLIRYSYDVDEMYSHIRSVIIRYYLSIRKNNYINLSDKENKIKRLIDNFVILSPLKDEVDEVSSIYDSFSLYIMKAQIDEKDEVLFEYSLKKIKKSNEFSNPKSNQKITLIISIYLYYLTNKESLVDMKSYDKLFKNNISQLTEDIMYMDSLWEHYEEVRKKLHSWEVFEELEAKWMMMDSVVKEFFIFLSSINHLDIISHLKDKSLLLELALFFDMDHKELLRLYSNFKEFLNTDKKNMEIELDNIYEQILYTFKAKRVQEVKLLEEKYLKNKEWIGKYENVNSIKQSSFFQVINHDDNLVTSKMNILNSLARVDDFTESNRERIFARLLEKVQYQLEINILKAFLNYGVVYTVVQQRNRDKLKLLEKYIHRFKPDTLFTGIKHTSAAMYFEESREKYTDILDNLSSEFSTKHNLWFGFTKENYTINLSDIVISIKDLDRQIILRDIERYKNEKNGYLIPMINNLSVSFNKEEAVSYLQSKNKIITFEANIGISVNDANNSGFLINVI